MALFRKIGHFLAPDKVSKKTGYSHLLQRNINPYELWTVESELGDGSFGKVYRAVNKETGVLSALKEVPVESDEDLEDHMVELSILHECKHRNIIALLEAYLYDDKIMMLLEYCGGGAVDNIMIELDKPLTEAQIRYTCHEMCEGLAFLHKSFVIHRDIKAGNVLLSLNGAVKLADFGVSAKDTRAGVKHTTFIGTPYWMAPEVAICDAVKDEPYDCRADIWSLGITLIELAQMQPPHHEMSPMRVIMRILKSEPPTLDRPSLWSSEFSDFLSHCLMKNPDDRWSIADLLKHPFVKDATDPQPVLLLLAEFGADVCETQEEVTDPDVIKRFSTHGAINGVTAPSPTMNKAPELASLNITSKNNDHAIEMDHENMTSPSSPSMLSKSLVAKSSSAENRSSRVLNSSSPSYIDVSEVDELTLSHVISELIVDVLLDDVNSPSVPECVATAISDYVQEQFSKTSAKTPAPMPATVASKSAPEPKTNSIRNKLEAQPATQTPQRRLPRTKYEPDAVAEVQSVGTDLTEVHSPPQKRLSVAEMAKMLQQKLGHSSDSEEQTVVVVPSQKAPAPKGLPRTSAVAKPTGRASNIDNNDSLPRNSDTNVSVADATVLPTKKPPPPLPPRHSTSSSSSYQEDASTLYLPNTSVNQQQLGVTVSSIPVNTSVPTESTVRSTVDNTDSQKQENRESIERSSSRYRTLVRVRKFEFGGKTVTTSTSHLIAVNEGGNSTVVDRSKVIARERRRHLRELKILQRAENKAYQEMLTKSNVELDQQAKRIEAERDTILARCESEEEVLRQQQKQNLEGVERLQAREMKALIKRLNEQQEREFKTLRETGKEELKALEREIGRLPKDLRKQTLRIKTTMKQDELARREVEFARRQEEKMQLEKRTLAESHRGDLLRLEQQFLEQQQQIRRKQENEMAQLEERQVHEKHALSQRHILAAYKLKQQQMQGRHQREIARLRAESDQSIMELKHSQSAEMKLIPRKIREESKVRLQMYKEKLRIESKKSGISDMRLGFMNLVGDGNREKIREFEMEEKKRKEEYQDRVERRHKIALAKLEAENEALIKETEMAHAEALRQLADAEATKLNELDREFQEELMRCHNAHLAAQNELEARFREELEDQRRFYHVPVHTSSSSSPNSTAAVGLSVRSSKSSFGVAGYSNDDSLSTGTASSSENHQQRMFHSQHGNGFMNGNGGGLPRSTLAASDYELALGARSSRDIHANQMTQSSISMQHTSLDRQKTHAIYTSEML